MASKPTPGEPAGGTALHAGGSRPVAEPSTLPPPAALAGQRRLPSGELFRGAVEVEIVHHGHVYRLRQTTLGKLLLTK